MLENFNKETPPTFDGEVRNDKEVETWIIGMKK